MAFAAKKQPPSLGEKLRLTADSIRALDVEIRAVIEEWIDEQKLAYPSIPRGTHEQMLMGRYIQPWYAVLGLAKERNG